MSLLETLCWYGEIIVDYIRQMLPCMMAALAFFVLVSPVRRRRLERKGLISGPWREGALLLFVMFCAGLAALTVFPAGFWSVSHWSRAFRGEKSFFPHVNWHPQFDSIQLTPFQEILRGLRGPWVMFLVLANIGIFSPIGFFMALLWRNPRWWKSLLTGMGVSCVIEFIQLFIGRRSDIDDVILNTTGALTGFLVFCLFRAVFPQAICEFQCKERMFDG